MHSKCQKKEWQKKSCKSRWHQGHSSSKVERSIMWKLYLKRTFVSMLGLWIWRFAILLLSVKWIEKQRLLICKETFNQLWSSCEVEQTGIVVSNPEGLTFLNTYVKQQLIRISSKALQDTHKKTGLLFSFFKNNKLYFLKCNGETSLFFSVLWNFFFKTKVSMGTLHIHRGV